jgi:hypothetical protein
LHVGARTTHPKKRTYGQKKEAAPRLGNAKETVAVTKEKERVAKEPMKETKGSLKGQAEVTMLTPLGPKCAALTRKNVLRAPDTNPRINKAKPCVGITPVM